MGIVTDDEQDMNPIFGRAFDVLDELGDRRPISSSFLHTVTGVIASKYPFVGAAFIAYQIKDYTLDRRLGSLVGDLGEFAAGLLLSGSQR